VRGKIHASAFKSVPEDQKVKYLPGQRVDSDYKPMSVRSLGGSTGRYLYVDRGAKGYLWLKMVANREQQLQKFQEVVAESYELTARNMAHLKCDGSGDYMSGDMTTYMKKIGAKRTKAGAYASQQHGYAECYNRIVDEPTCVIMTAANAPSYLWAEAMMYVVQIYNIAFYVTEEYRDEEGKVQTRRTSRANLMRGQFREFNHETLHPWGVLVYVYLTRKQRKGQGTPHKTKCYIAAFMGLGYNPGAYRVLVLQSRTVNEVPTNFCIFNWKIYPFATTPQTRHELTLPPTFLAEIQEAEDAEEHLKDPEVDIEENMGQPGQSVGLPGQNARDSEDSEEEDEAQPEIDSSFPESVGPSQEERIRAELRSQEPAIRSRVSKRSREPSSKAVENAQSTLATISEETGFACTEGCQCIDCDGAHWTRMSKKSRLNE
jgi:hypothetical protein